MLRKCLMREREETGKAQQGNKRRQEKEVKAETEDKESCWQLLSHIKGMLR